MSGSVFGQASLSDANSEFNANSFLVRQILTRIATSTLAQVVSVTNSGGVSPVGTVDIIPMVNQIDGSGNPTPHIRIYQLPYFRLQGGTDAVILDPKVGDIGIVVFASRDISTVKSTKKQANPGSLRKFSMADGLYIGGVLNGVPQQYLQFTSSGITVTSPNTVTINASGTTVNSPLTVNGAITATGDVTGSGISLVHHVHTGVQGGTGTTGPAVG